MSRLTTPPTTSITRSIYPLDYTGYLSSNLIDNESVTLLAQSFRAFTPIYAPFFGNTIKIKDLTTDQFLTKTQFQLYNLVSAPTAISGATNPLYSVIIILDSTVSANLEVTYQTVGGDYCVGYDSLVTLINDLISNPRPITWNNVANLPVSFPENFHLHSLGDTVGWEFLSSELEQLRMAILAGDQIKKDFVLTYIDNAITSLNAAQAALTTGNTPFATHVSNTSNPHNVTAAQIGLGNVQNYQTATNAQALAGTVGNLYVTASQVSNIVQNAVDLGMDAHVLNTSNPHNVTAAQVGLGNLQNYGVATLSDLQTPVSGTPKYVINTTLGSYLTAYFNAQTSNINAGLATLTNNVATAANNATAALTAANGANTAANNAVSAINGAVTASTNALAAATANVTAAAGAATAAQTLLNAYTAEAVTAAQIAYYSKGYTDGHAAALAGN